MQQSDLKSLDLKQLQDLKALNDYYLERCLPISQTPKFALKIRAFVLVPLNEHENLMKVKAVSFVGVDFVPPEFKKAFEDYTTRLISENWLIDDAIDSLTKNSTS